VYKRQYTKPPVNYIHRSTKPKKNIKNHSHAAFTANINWRSNVGSKTFASTTLNTLQITSKYSYTFTIGLSAIYISSIGHMLT